MASFLDMDQKNRELYVSRHLDLNPNDRPSWPLDAIQAIIESAEDAADRTVRNHCRVIGRRGQTVRD